MAFRTVVGVVIGVLYALGVGENVSLHDRTEKYRPTG